MPLTTAWEQMNIARAFDTNQIWIVNVGSLKPLELPTEHFLALAYDFDAWPRNSLRSFLEMWAAREFGEKVKEEVGDIMYLYSVSGGAVYVRASLMIALCLSVET